MKRQRGGAMKRQRGEAYGEQDKQDWQVLCDVCFDKFNGEYGMLTNPGDECDRCGYVEPEGEDEDEP